jgi:hypothetical protein
MEQYLPPSLEPFFLAPPLRKPPQRAEEPLSEWEKDNLADGPGMSPIVEPLPHGWPDLVPPRRAGSPLVLVPAQEPWPMEPNGQYRFPGLWFCDPATWRFSR